MHNKSAADQYSFQTNNIENWYSDKLSSKILEIIKRHEYTTSRLWSLSSADILAGIKFGEPITTLLENEAESFDAQRVPDQDDKERSNFPDIDFDVADSTKPYAHLNGGENMISNALFEDSRRHGSACKDTVISYNNPFDPRLSFDGLMTTEKDNSPSNWERIEQNPDTFNCLLDAVNPSSFANAYLNKYNKYLSELRKNSDVFGKVRLVVKNVTSDPVLDLSYHVNERKETVVPDFVGNDRLNVELWSRISATKRFWSEEDAVVLPTGSLVDGASTCTTDIRPSFLPDQTSKANVPCQLTTLNACAQSFEVTDKQHIKTILKRHDSGLSRSSSEVIYTNPKSDLLSEKLHSSSSLYTGSVTGSSNTDVQHPPKTPWSTSSDEAGNSADSGDATHGLKNGVQRDSHNPDHGEMYSAYTDVADKHGNTQWGPEGFVDAFSSQAAPFSAGNCTNKMGTSFVHHTEQIHQNPVFTMNVLESTAKPVSLAATPMFWSHQQRQSEQLAYQQSQVGFKRYGQQKQMLQNQNEARYQQRQNVTSRPVSQPDFGKGKVDHAGQTTDYSGRKFNSSTYDQTAWFPHSGGYNTYGPHYNQAYGYGLGHTQPEGQGSGSLLSLNIVQQQSQSREIKFDDEVWYINGVPHKQAKPLLIQPHVSDSHMVGIDNTRRNQEVNAHLPVHQYTNQPYQQYVTSNVQRTNFWNDVNQTWNRQARHQSTDWYSDYNNNNNNNTCDSDAIGYKSSMSMHSKDVSLSNLENKFTDDSNDILVGSFEFSDSGSCDRKRDMDAQVASVYSDGNVNPDLEEPDKYYGAAKDEPVEYLETAESSRTENGSSKNSRRLCKQQVTNQTKVRQIKVLGGRSRSDKQKRQPPRKANNNRLRGTTLITIV